MFSSARNATNEEGFSLIELVVGVVIIGALSTVTISSLDGLTHRASAVACNADVQTVKVAADAFMLLSPDGKPASDLHTLVTAGYLAADPGDVTYTPLGTSFTAVGETGCS